MSLPDPSPSTAVQHAFLFADPAAHSLSPQMHRAAFAHAGIAGDYVARRVLAADLPEAVAGLRGPDILGANLSLPHKESVLALLADLSPAAQAIGAVNTIIHRGGRLRGDNTDAPGFLAALADAGAPTGGLGVVLGAGGAARAAVYALKQAGYEVLIVNRTHARAQALAAELGGRAAWMETAPWGAVTLVVNASSAGLNAPEDSPLSTFPPLNPSALVYDMVYRPAETRLLRDARAAGLRTENGLGMLAHQARLAFMAWTGTDVPVSVFLGALAGSGGLAESGDLAGSGDRGAGGDSP
ncbi:shikimate dehydrogenase [Deinococcus arenicola]|uniref:Shikimate dehydrogenase (NADP(+)) n=1 Tax=Deinococcus arenicola TaxID=2994950 RepID=A0ABU4DKZ4_9DEIO|nr:shikimate dehydrogenase [Deinococcus sp. ZS9-10]MDV6373018.1 shikimate dehydrogenase [Deinococcus sp. ZS9-10]